LRALILGGTGLVGRAAARRLLAAGWDVDVTGRDPSHCRAGNFLSVDRDDPKALRDALGSGADLLVDCICFTAEHARALVPLLGGAGSTVMISSKAVYVDELGNHSNSDVQAHFAGPVKETQPTLPPGDMPYQSRDGYGPNKVAAEQVLLDTGAPVTILRPSKIHGEGSMPPREWVYVKRVLDERPVCFFAHRGEGIDHPTAAVNIAALIETAAAKPGARILNSADPDAPNALEISRAIARHLGHTWDEVLVDDDSLGRHPWDKRPPVILDTSAALELGYEPVGDYATTVVDEVDWLVNERPALDDGLFGGYLDYGAEDRFLDNR
jgi:nucleoside-diphosphate-sugar epimerase